LDRKATRGVREVNFSIVRVMVVARKDRSKKNQT